MMAAEEIKDGNRSNSRNVVYTEIPQALDKDQLIPLQNY
jgi:hypothetical protein